MISEGLKSVLYLAYSKFCSYPPENVIRIFKFGIFIKKKRER